MCESKSNSSLMKPGKILHQSDALQVSQYGGNLDHPDLIILSQHAADGHDYIRRHAEGLQQVTGADRETLMQHCYLEHDWPLSDITGSLVDTLTGDNEVTENLRSIGKKIGVILIDHRLPRGIRDTNRDGISSIRTLKLRGQESHPYQQLEDSLYGETMTVTQDIFRKVANVNPNFRFINPHTMAPYQISGIHDHKNHQNITLSSGNQGIFQYSERWADKKFWTTRRENCFIDAKQGITDPEEEQRLDNYPLTRYLERLLAHNGISTTHNNPYGFMDNGVIACEGLVKNYPYRGMVIDYVRDLFSTHSAEHPNFDALNLRLSPDKLQKIVNLTAKAIVDTSQLPIPQPLYSEWNLPNQR